MLPVLRQNISELKNPLKAGKIQPVFGGYGMSEFCFFKDAEAYTVHGCRPQKEDKRRNAGEQKDNAVCKLNTKTSQKIIQSQAEQYGNCLLYTSIIGRRSEERSMKNGFIKERLTTLTNVKSFFVTKQPTCRICSCG